MKKKIFGSILMILGTSLGAGMLALPVVTAQENYFTSFLLLSMSWFLMTIGAFSLLEVNLWLAPGTNLISMAKLTLGRWGKSLTWVAYLLLLYSLICAYLSGTSDILQGLVSMMGISLPRWLATTFNMILFTTIIYRGIGSVDMLNRALMSVKLISYVILVTLTIKKLNSDYMMQGDYHWHMSAIMVMLTSFGYAILIPSLRSYLNSDAILLKKVIFFGSLLPLIIYALWVLVIQDLVPREGSQGLISMLSASDTNTLLMQNISRQLHNPWLSTIANLFISISAITSLLGVSICLTDFIADGINIPKQSKAGILIYLISFLPPLLIVLISPGIFIRALSYAGLLCLVLLILIPVAMLYRGRYILHINHKKIVPGGKCLLLSVLIIGFILLIANFF